MLVTGAPGYRARVDPSAEGLTYPEVAFDVDPAHVAAFGEVFGVKEGVFPTFLTAAEFSVLPGIVEDPRVGVNFANVVHGSQEYEIERPPRDGERLAIRSRIESVKIRGGVGFMTIVMDIVDDAGETVAVCRSSMIEREVP